MGWDDWIITITPNKGNMNKIIKIILIIEILLACTMLVAFKSQETNTKYIRTNYVNGTHGKTYVIESLEELEEYYNANKEKHNLGHREKVYSDTTIGFVDATKEYDELSRVVRKLEEEEKNISANNTNDYIRKEQLKEINNILSDESVDLLDSQIMRKLLNCIEVIDKHTVEFQFNCNLNIIEKL